MSYSLFNEYKFKNIFINNKFNGLKKPNINNLKQYNKSLSSNKLINSKKLTINNNKLVNNKLKNNVNKSL